MDDGDHEFIENPECHEALLGIVEAIVFVGKGRALKHPRSVGKVEAVLFDIQLALRVTPREPHRLVYIRDAYASTLAAAQRTKLTGVRVE